MADKTYEEYSIGEKFVSYARTITEADLVNFTSLAGLKSPLFIDDESARSTASSRSACSRRASSPPSIAAGMLEDILGKYLLAGPRHREAQIPGAGERPATRLRCQIHDPGA